MMKIFDTHAHYDSSQFDCDRDEILTMIHGNNTEQENEVVLKNYKCIEEKDLAAESDIKKDFVRVERIINVGADMASSYTTVELAKRYDFIYAAVGVHPDSAGELVEGAFLTNRENLKSLALDKKAVAIGEIGLDYHWDVWPRNVQQEAFRWQWGLAQELNLPVIIHSRDAAEDTLNMVKAFYKAETKSSEKNLRAVMHCYSYSVEHAEEYLKMGLMFGIGGVVTFKNAKKLKEVVDMLPVERILLETDCPYMAPEPYRGKRNNSGYLNYVAQKIAEIKGIDVKTVYDRTYENAERFFHFDCFRYGKDKG